MKRRLLSIIKAPFLPTSELRVWWPVLGIIILLSMMVILRHPYIQECAIVALVFATFMYMVLTKKTLDETKRQRLDASRPLLVPDGGTAGVACYGFVFIGYQELLHVRNIGLGPAENIAIRLELRSVNSPPTVQLDETQTAVEPLMSGSKGRVSQWKIAKKSIEMYDDYWIVISYDDLFHRHFETEARWIKERDSWVSIKTVPVKQLPPRVRDVNYYATLNGSG